MAVARRTGAALFALVVLALPFTGLVSDYGVAMMDDIGIASLVALGLVILTGVGGMTSFGQAAFVGFGAYASAVITLHTGLSPWLALPLAVIVTMLWALVIGAVTVRLSGHYLPLGTIAWGIAFYYLFANIDGLGGHDGLSGIPPLSIAGHALTGVRDYFVVVWAVVVLAFIATRNLLRGRTGRAMRALREGTLAAEAFGIRPASLKLAVFVYAAMLAGIAGWLYAHFQRSVSPGPFGVITGTEYLLMAVLGGSGRIAGAILGAALVIVLRDQLQSWLPYLTGSRGNYETVVFGALLVLLLRGASEGLWPKLAGHPRPPDFGKADAAAVKPRERLRLDEPVIEARYLIKRFGGLFAVNDVSLTVPAGRIIGLIGPNGAGKSTTFNLITGVLRPNRGDVLFRGTRVTPHTPQQLAQLGVARSFQHAAIVSDMSVVENVMIGAHLRGRAGMVAAILGLDRGEEARLHAAAVRALVRTGLADVAAADVDTLSLGQLRLLEIARALALDPLVLLLDEPAAGLRVGEKKALAALLRELRSEGISVLLVEHDMDFVMSLADHLVVLDFGMRIAEGDGATVRDDPKVIEAYLGGVA